MSRLIPLFAYVSIVFGMNVHVSHGQDNSDFDPAVLKTVESCVRDAVERYQPGDACVGVLFQACGGSGQSTYEMVHCFRKETDYWTSMMDRQLVRLKKHYQANGRQSIDGTPLQDSLATAQEAWQKYYEAQCRFRYDENGMGSMRKTKAAVCDRDLAADRALFLMSLAADP